MSQSVFQAITCDFLKAREKSRLQDHIGVVWLLIGVKTGATFLSQSLSMEILIA